MGFQINFSRSPPPPPHPFKIEVIVGGGGIYFPAFTSIYLLYDLQIGGLSQTSSSIEQSRSFTWNKDNIKYTVCILIAEIEPVSSLHFFVCTVPRYLRIRTKAKLIWFEINEILWKGNFSSKIYSYSQNNYRLTDLFKDLQTYRQSDS